MKPWNPTDNQLLCRDLRHSWEPFNAWRKGRGYVRELRCSRCHSYRTQWLDSEGYVLLTRVRYSDGYVRKEGGRLTSDEQALVRLYHLDHTPEPNTGEEDKYDEMKGE